jgi:hypothetical protein
MVGGDEAHYSKSIAVGTAAALVGSTPAPLRQIDKE